MKSDADFLHIAIQLAKQSLREGELPIGAIVVLNGEVIGQGRRRKKQNTRIDHAEIMALRRAIEKTSPMAVRQATLYSTLEPCVMCVGALLNSYMKRVAYSLEDPFGGATALITAPLPVRHHEHIPEVASGILREEVIPLFRCYFATTKSEFWRTAHRNPLVLLCQTPTLP